jgi:hypothetical protein
MGVSPWMNVKKSRRATLRRIPQAYACGEGFIIFIKSAEINICGFLIADLFFYGKTANIIKSNTLDII